MVFMILGLATSTMLLQWFVNRPIAFGNGSLAFKQYTQTMQGDGSLAPGTW